MRSFYDQGQRSFQSQYNNHANNSQSYYRQNRGYNRSNENWADDLNWRSQPKNNSNSYSNSRYSPYSFSCDDFAHNGSRNRSDQKSRYNDESKNRSDQKSWRKK